MSSFLDYKKGADEMGFTIRCDNCGQEQKLSKDDFYDKEKISLENDRFAESYEALSISCKNCSNCIY